MTIGESKTRIEVSGTYPIREKQRLLVHLKSSDWDYRGHMNVRLRQGGAELRAKQVRYGSVRQELVVALSPLSEWSEAMTTLDKMRANPEIPIYLETETEGP